MYKFEAKFSQTRAGVLKAPSGRQTITNPPLDCEQRSLLLSAFIMLLLCSRWIESRD